jgi:hypothetical protein
MGEGDFGINALLGAVVAVATSFTGVGPILGGMAAGYLNRRDGVKIGAVSGLITAVPIVLLFAFMGSIFAAMPVMGGMMGGPAAFGIGGALALVFLAIGFVFLLVYTIGLGALGGYLGVYLYEEDVI